ncbi:hypothetical protein C8R43DRAFT_901207 [Mycena crocata]|nr:hypothetical protein C8R43DRAFT_901207 [Mycena crocata]
MNFQSLPLPPPRLYSGTDSLLEPVQNCGCNCLAACRCTCSCRDHCACTVPCEGDCATHVSRNLVVSLDGAFHKLGVQNTNVLELHNRVLVDPVQRQLTYYKCGIGTYVPSKRRSLRHCLQRLVNKVDVVFGWNFGKIIIEAYRWLCEQYHPGDRIFLFGFSRGAYQVRTLATMVEKVRQTKVCDSESIRFRFELPAFVLRFPLADTLGAAVNFKTTFSQSVKIHFIGAWDTGVSSVGLAHSRRHHPLPSACIFRHALAIDECRVRFLPAVSTGALYGPPPKVAQIGANDQRESASTETKISIIPKLPSLKGIPEMFRKPGRASETSGATIETGNIKEVWFAGKHAQV